ncbi:hypothetical protein E2C01_008230 [Portunus trituberculatus]|uniref:Uncharacterized protein n=1 Tax=Portunus trituberculatus TaxID=210409 RepID=A0A5B7D176_PORTR|nr:hypothetical protein [Portunus trituberculatus]
MAFENGHVPLQISEVSQKTGTYDLKSPSLCVMARCPRCQLRKFAVSCQVFKMSGIMNEVWNFWYIFCLIFICFCV